MKNPNLSSRAGVVHTLAKTTLLCFLSACAIGWLATSANAVGRGWTGSASGNWSNPNNWDPVGTPQDGEDLYFDISAVFFSPDPMFNDLTNLAVRSLYFSANADIITVDWELSGNTLDIAHDITLSASTTEHVYINCGFRLVGNTKFDVDWSTDGSELHVNGPMDLNGHNLSLIADQNCLLEVSGVVSGTGDINVNVNPQGGPIGTVRLSGTQGNTFLGTVTLRDSPGAFGGTIGSGLLLNKQSGVAVPDRLVLEQNCRVGLGAPQQIGDNAPVSLGGGSRFLLNGNNETIGNLILTNSATDTDATVVDIGGGTLTLLGGITSGSDGGSVIPTVTGRLGLAAGGHVFDIGGVSYAGLDLQAQIAGLGGFSKFGRAALLLQTNNTFTGGVSVNAGILDVRHNSALGATSSGTTLLGSGTLTLRNATIAGETLFVRGDAQVTVNTAGSLLFTIGNCSWTGPIELDTNLVLWADNTTLSGPISGVGGMAPPLSPARPRTLMRAQPAFSQPWWSSTRRLPSRRSAVHSSSAMDPEAGRLRRAG